MSETKHTPGPWRVEEGTTLIWGDCNQDDTSSYGMGYPIAECRLTPSGSWAKGPKTYGEAEANAHLISAAPDLLEALESLIIKYVRLVNSGDAGFWNPEDDKEVIAARAAIAKVEGRS